MGELKNRSLLKIAKFEPPSPFFTFVRLTDILREDVIHWREKIHENPLFLKKTNVLIIGLPLS